MADRPVLPDARQARLAAALRANLRRRKADAPVPGGQAGPPAAEHDAPSRLGDGADER